MRITIIADASHCPDTGKAGYGFWIASQRGKLGGDGVLKGCINNNISAEIMALMNALHAGINAGLICRDDSVLLQTDCQSAIDAFEGRRQSMSAREKELVKFYLSLRKRYSLNISMKHVKGHTRNKDARYVVNNICDRKARQHMRKARDLHNLNLTKEELFNEE